MGQKQTGNNRQGDALLIKRQSWRLVVNYLERIANSI